jgi:uncharacterized membrane protein YoaK (UPF0700 family)
MPSTNLSADPQLALSAARQRRAGLALVALLSILAGMTDAIGFLSTGDYVSFMSGNTTRLAIGLGNEQLATMFRLALALLTFVIGNALGVVIVRVCGRRASPLLLIIGLIMCGTALAPPNHWTVLLSAILSMGMLNAAVEQVSGIAIGLTYITGALSRMGRGLGRWVMGEPSGQWLPQLIPWLGMFAGAVAGAMLHTGFGPDAMAAAGILAFMVAGVFLLVPREWQLGYLPS